MTVGERVAKDAGGRSVTVRKHTWQGVFRYSWEGEVISRATDRVVIRAVWQGPGEPVVGEISFATGDIFVEYYYPGKGYAIWQVERPDGAIKGWYCNISTPVREQSGVLSFDDLLLDVLVYPEGRYTILDRDEFDAAREAGLSDAHAALAEAAVQELIGLIVTGAPPFSFAPATAPAVETA